ncbi:uncharacterized [Tachysurus ichikawai]
MPQVLLIYPTQTGSRRARGAGLERLIRADNRYQPPIDMVQQSPRNIDTRHRFEFPPGGHGKVRQEGLYPHHLTAAFTTATIAFTPGV